MSSAEFSDRTFLLPGGLVLEEGRCLRTAVLRPLTGHEEEWFAGHPRIPAAVAATHILSACLVSLDDVTVTKNLVRQLLIGDRDYLVLQLRRLTLGDDFQAVFACPACDAKMDVSFKASEIPIECRTQQTAKFSIHLADPQPSGRTVSFRLPTGGDQEAALGMGNDPVQAILDRCILGDGGSRLSLQEREAVIEAMERTAPEVDLELDLSCPECGKTFLVRFDTTAFFFDEMRISAKQLLRELHALAFYYHWSEAEILRLRRDRRRAYLGLLNETARQD
jgi:hypothetical protein